jgi:hypothetical protein
MKVPAMPDDQGSHPHHGGIAGTFISVRQGHRSWGRILFTGADVGSATAPTGQPATERGREM